MGKRIQWTFLKQFHSKTVALGVYDYVYVGVSAQIDPKVSRIPEWTCMGKSRYTVLPVGICKSTVQSTVVKL